MVGRWNSSGSSGSAAPRPLILTSQPHLYNSKPFPSKIPRFSNFLNISVPPKKNIDAHISKDNPKTNYCWWKKSCTSWCGKYPIIYRVSYMSAGDRRISEPLIVWWDTLTKFINGSTMICKIFTLPPPMSTTSHGGTSDVNFAFWNRE